MPRTQAVLQKRANSPDGADTAFGILITVPDANLEALLDADDEIEDLDPKVSILEISYEASATPGFTDLSALVDYQGWKGSPPSQATKDAVEAEARLRYGASLTWLDFTD